MVIRDLRLLLTVLGGLAIGGCAQQMAAQGTSGCLPSGSTRVQDRIDYLRDLVSSADTDRVSMRGLLGIPSANANKVGLVTKTSTCQSAVAGLNAILGTPNTARQVWVFTTGSGYAVDDPSLDVLGRDRDLYILDTQFASKGVVNGF